VQIESELDGHVVPREVFDLAMEHYGYSPVFMENSGQDINDFNFSAMATGKKPCLVFGNEGYGIPDSFIGRDACVKIKQLGVMRSLNVSAACAIACHVCSTQLFNMPTRFSAE
jgi:tRNA G18 (ribose-2'-O)-methylase SpoU